LFLSTFDDANVLDCYRRSESIVPQQALALTNSRLAQALAEKIASRLQERPGSAKREDFIRSAFLLILGTPPTASELAECRLALADWGDDPRGRKLLIGVLLNHNDFIAIR
jgi:hypothetical protein